jgi:hypothetical protein
MRRHGRHLRAWQGIAGSTGSNPRERHTQTHPRSATSASVAVAAGRSSDSGLPTPLPLPISFETVRWLRAEQRFVPITAAGQRRILTSFPFNRLFVSSLTCTSPFYIANAIDRGTSASSSAGSKMRISKFDIQKWGKIPAHRQVADFDFLQDIHNRWYCISIFL